MCCIAAGVLPRLLLHAWEYEGMISLHAAIMRLPKPCWGAVQCEIVDHLNAPQLDRYVDRLVEARKKKNLTPDGARDLLHDANYFGTARIWPPPARP